jgi:uncharacterized protein DUF2806
LETLNIPRLIAGPAGEAISRLIGGVADIPVAWLQQFSQPIKDRTEATHIVNKAIAEATAKLAVSDPEIVGRAVNSLVAKAYRSQKNREAVAYKTIELLQERADGAERPPEDPEGRPASLDEDWLNIFEQYAEQASSERLQEIWARILAGEIRRPQTFSLKTLRFVSELDRDIASTFERYVSSVVSDDFIPRPSKLEGEILNDFLKLQDYGLVTSVEGFINKNISIDHRGFAFLYRKHAVHIKVSQDHNVQVPAVLLTKVGREVAKILDPIDSIERAKELVDLVPKQR